MKYAKQIIEYYESISDGNGRYHLCGVLDEAEMPRCVWAEKEERRVFEMYCFDGDANSYEEGGCPKPVADVVAGVDEVGRGPMAGPVTACAVILPEKQFYLPGLNDSKAVPEKLRTILHDIIKAHAVCWATGMATAEEIDELNIHRAVLLAMTRAVKGLRIKPGLLLVDGNKGIPHLGVKQKTVVKGDSKSAAIAAASIIAKVTRDAYMKDLDGKYPQYGFASHNGYCTGGHKNALKEHGPCPEHRKSYAPVRAYLNPDPPEQLSLI